MIADLGYQIELSALSRSVRIRCVSSRSVLFLTASDSPPFYAAMVRSLLFGFAVVTGLFVLVLFILVWILLAPFPFLVAPVLSHRIGDLLSQSVSPPVFDI